MKEYEFNVIMDEARKRKLLIEPIEPSKRKDSSTFGKLGKILIEEGLEKGIDFLVSTLAKSQMKKAEESVELSSEKKNEIRQYWKKYTDLYKGD